MMIDDDDDDGDGGGDDDDDDDYDDADDDVTIVQSETWETEPWKAWLAAHSKYNDHWSS